MNTEGHRQLNQLLEAALALPRSERIAFAQRECGADKVLLAEITALLSSESDAAAWLPAPPFSKTPIQVGPFLLKELLGQGGMGAVYRAERNDGAFEQEVAVKLIRTGRPKAVTMRRFQAERQILAAMEHPYIARLLDGGSTGDGLPYLVMEYVKGRHLNEYIEEECLSIEARIDLFIPICRAVEEAHRHLVVHQDLKPSNILITEDGLPKLLDFGIARLLESEKLDLTAPGKRAMSPRYASPEQINGETITTASDIYSLGTLFYEQLTENFPFGNDLNTIQILKMENQNKPVPTLFERVELPSGFAQKLGISVGRLRNQLSGDLNTIVLKTLERDFKDRYATVRELREDLERYRGGHPIRARRPSFLYVAQRFLKRHLWSALATVATLLLLIAFTVVTSLQRQQLERREKRLLIEYEKSQTVLSFMLSLFQQADPGESAAMDPPVSEILKRGRKLAGASMKYHPETRLAVLNSIAQAYTTLGSLDEAESVLTETFDFAQTMSKDLREVRHISMIQADLNYWRGKMTESKRLLLNLIREMRPNDPYLWRAKVHYLMARTLHESADYGEVGPYLDQARELLRGKQGESVTMLGLEIEILWSHMLFRTGKNQASLKSTNQALALAKKTWRNAHPIVGEIYKIMGYNHHTLGDFEQAERYFQKSLAISQHFWGEQHFYTSEVLTMLGFLFLTSGRIEQARDHYNQAEVIHRRVLGENHVRTANIYQNLASLYFLEEQFEMALTYNRKAWTIRLAKKGATHPLTLQTQAFGAQVYAELQRWAEAIQQIQATVTGYTQIADSTEGLAQSYTVYAKILSRMERFEEAQNQAETSIELYRQWNLQHPNAPYAFFYCGQAALRQYRFLQAITYLEEGLELSEKRFGPDGQLTLKITVALAEALVRDRAFHRAEPILNEFRMRLSNGKQNEELRVMAEALYAVLLAHQGCRQEAQELIQQQVLQLEKISLGGSWRKAVMDHAEFIAQLEK